VQSLETGGYWSLTERELEIMHLLNQGLTRTEIAKSQSVSQNTVKTHLKNIYSKLGVHSRSEVLRIAKENEQ
jgi:LuxR family maltose regulon positive regulatory protein